MTLIARRDPLPPNLPVIADLHPSAAKAGDDVEFAVHGLDEAARIAHIGARPLFHLRDRALATLVRSGLCSTDADRSISIAGKADRAEA